MATDSLATANLQHQDRYARAAKHQAAAGHQWSDERQLIILGLVIAILLGVVGLVVTITT